MRTVTSTTYDQLELGASATFTREVTEGDVRAFATLSGDTNPIHLDEDYARTTQFEGRIVHGALTSAHISAALATTMPGPGTIYIEQQVRFRRPVRIGDALTTTVTVTEKVDAKGFVRLSTIVTNQKGEKVAVGEAVVMPPKEPITVELRDRA